MQMEKPRDTPQPCLRELRVGDPRGRQVERVISGDVAKTSYGIVFVVVLPLMLWAWAARTSNIGLHGIHSLGWGYATATAGLILIASGMLSLWRVGGGLPMNAFPPPHYVSTGVYRVFRHPIYVGFAMMCVGAAVASGSASSL